MKSLVLTHQSLLGYNLNSQFLTLQIIQWLFWENPPRMWDLSLLRVKLIVFSVSISLWPNQILKCSCLVYVHAHVYAHPCVFGNDNFDLSHRGMWNFKIYLIAKHLQIYSLKASRNISASYVLTHFYIIITLG